MLYAIITEELPGALPRRLAARPAHLARLQALQDEGRLVLSGPHPMIDSEDPGPAGFSGSLIVAEFASLDAATAWAYGSSAAQANVFAKVTVKPFKRVF